jgi:DNA-binding transcriptional ArsR family regulator
MSTVTKLARAEAAWFFVFANPVRLAILRGLAAGPLAVKDLAAALGLGQSYVGAYLRELTRAGVVAAESDGHSNRCSLLGARVERHRVTFRHRSGRSVSIPRQAPAS